MKKKLLITAGIILLAGVGILACFWESLAVWIAPKTVLTGALHTAAQQLQQRWEDSPVSIIAGYLEPEGCYSAQLDLRMDSNLLGPVNYRMDLSLDTENNRLMAEGVVQTQRNDLDLTLYLDRDYMAVSSRDFLGGGYYGITYETFPEDIRSIPLMSMFISENTISGWETSVVGIQSAMNRSYSLPQLPELSPEALRDVLAAVLLLPGRVEREQLTVNGVLVQGHRIDYSASGESVLALLSGLMNTGDGASAEISASFWLYDDQIVMGSLRGQAGGNTIDCSVELLCDENTVALRLARREDGREQGFCIRHTAVQDHGVLREVWSIYQDYAGTGEETRVAYSWEEASGRLTLDGEGEPVVTIRETGGGLIMKTEDLLGLWNGFAGKTGPENPVFCELTLGPGEKVAAPGYKNLDQWMLEDLLVLLRGIGGLFGLDTQ